MTATAKNQKDRIVEMSRMLGDLLQLGASMQSTDAEVLRDIKRTNISLDAIVKMAKGATASQTGSFTEIILGLPGDTKDKHIKSVFDMLDAGIQDVRSFQFILLPGTEGSDTASRERYQYDTGFRVLARCFGRYDDLRRGRRRSRRSRRSASATARCRATTTSSAARSTSRSRSSTTAAS